MGTKLKPGKFDCYMNAEPDEPMFVLLARDRHAPTLIWLWAAMRELEGETPAQVAEARQCVSAMLEWQAVNGRKAAGLGHAALVGTIELMRAANYVFKNAPDPETIDARLRMYLAHSEMESEAVAPPENAGGKSA